MNSMTNQATLALLLALSLLAGPGTANADGEGQKTFDTREAAGQALVVAAKADDTAALVAILGPGSEDLVASGDPVADDGRREKFVTGYEQKHHWTSTPDGLQVLDTGDSDWPFPVPLVETEDGWRFDTEQGDQEILNRRIGRNELGAIQACLVFVDAEQEYHARKPMGEPARYAQVIASSEGTKDGLFWETAKGEEPSPLGEVFAAARAQGYSATQGSGEPFHGYVYRVLHEQGDDAYGGELDYVVDGAMTKGFALIASPAKYGASGIMTFLVNQTGVIYQKDLSDDTSEIVAKTDSFDPDESWDVVSAAARRPPNDAS